MDDLLELLGYLNDGTPIWAMTGAEGDDDDDDDAGENDDTNDDDGDDDDDSSDDDTERKHPKSAKAKDTAAKKAATKAGAYKPPSEREWRNTQAALKKANEEQRAARKAALEKARKEGQDEAAAKAREEAAGEAERTWHPRAVRSEARAMLAEERCKNPTRLLKLIDIDSVTWQGNEPIGLEPQIANLKEEWPELFATDGDAPKAKQKKEVPSAKKQGAAAGSGKKDEVEEKKDTRGAARIAGRLLGSSA